jgi:predicted nucleotidyltransferase
MEEIITNKQLEIISLFSSNYLKSFHTREIAKLLGKNHVSLLPHLKKLIKGKILISKINGKNKNYFLNLNNNLVLNYLNMSENMKSIVYLKKNFLIKKINQELFNLNLDGSFILFGSYVKGNFDEKSDIDLLYLGNIKESEIKKIKNIGEIYGKIINIKKSTLKNFEIGIRKKDSLIIEIIKNHILLKNKDIFINYLWRYFYEIKQE